MKQAVPPTTTTALVNNGVVVNVNAMLAHGEQRQCSSFSDRKLVFTALICWFFFIWVGSLLAWSRSWSDNVQ